MQAWSLPIPGIAIGVALTLAFQLLLRRMGRYKWARHLLQALDLSSIEGDDPGDPEGGEIHRMASGASSLTTQRGALWGSRLGVGRAALLLLRRMRRALLFAFVGDIITRRKEGGVSSGSQTSTTGQSDGPGSDRDDRASPPPPPSPSSSSSSTKEGQLEDLSGETVEWVNMCWRKVWRVYQKGLAQWIIDLLQPVLDSLVKDGLVPKFVQRLKIVELTLDHEAPYFSNMRRRNNRKDSDLTGVVDLRYTGGARMLLMLEVGEGRWKFQVPVLISDLDMECQLWMKLRLAPICPWIGTISLAFVGQPNVKVQLSPYNRVRLMRVPVVQTFLRKLFTHDLPGLMVLPSRLEIGIPPSVTSVAEAAVGRDTIMRAVASAVLQADAVEQALMNALPLGPMAPAGGITLPQSFKGELSVNLREARTLPVWGFPGQSNPYCRLTLGEQTIRSRSEDDTSHPGVHRAPVWNQEFQFLVKDPIGQSLEIEVRDSNMTGRAVIGFITFSLASLSPQSGSAMGVWLPVKPPHRPPGTPGSSFVLKEVEEAGEVLVDIIYRPFVDDEDDSGYREARRHLNEASLLTASLEAFSSPSSLSSQELSQLSPFQTSSSSPSPPATLNEITKTIEEEEIEIKDYRTATAASSRAAVAAYAAYNAIAMTQAAAARAATRAAKSAQQAASAAAAALQYQANADQEKEVEEYLKKSFGSSSPSESSDTDTASDQQDPSKPPSSVAIDVSSSSDEADDSSAVPINVASSSKISASDINRLNRLIEIEAQNTGPAVSLSGETRSLLPPDAPRVVLSNGERGEDGRAHVAIQQVWGLVDWAKGILPKGGKAKKGSLAETGAEIVDPQTSSDAADEEGKEGGESAAKEGGRGLWSFLPFKRSKKLKPLDSMEEGAPEGGVHASDPSSSSSSSTSGSSDKPWWWFWGSQGDQEVAEVTAEAKKAAEAIALQAQKDSTPGIRGGGDDPWWKFWAKGEYRPPTPQASVDGGGEKASAAAKGEGPVEVVYLPPDLSMEEIAKELAKLKESESRSRDDQMGQLWSAAVEKNDRSWMMVLCFLLTTAVGLLSVVAYKLDVLKQLGIIEYKEEISPGELIAGIKQPAIVTAPDVSVSASVVAGSSSSSASDEASFPADAVKLQLQYEYRDGDYRLVPAALLQD